MENLEESLCYIDVFCRTLVKKIAEDENCPQNITVEPIENFLRRKHITEEHADSNTFSNHLIPLPHAEKPLIDVSEDDNYVRILMKCRCKNQKVTVHTDAGDLKIYTEQCGKLDFLGDK